MVEPNQLSSKSSLRWMVAAALVVGGAALAYVSFGNIGDNLVYYWTPGELLAKGDKALGSTVRLGGVVAPGSVHWDEKSMKLDFKVADSNQPDATTVLVNATGAPPQMFREKIGVVVEGTIDQNKVFHSDRVMVNHSNEYRPPEGATASKGFGSGTLVK